MILATGLWLGLLVVGYAGGRLYGRYTLRRDGDDDGRSRGTYRLLAVVGLTALVVLAFSGLTDAAESALSSVHPALGGGFGTTLTWIPVLGGATVAVLVTYLGVFPYARKRRDLEISAATATFRLAKYLAAIAIFVLGALAPFAVLVGASDPSPLLIPFLLVALFVGVYGWSQYGIRLSQTVTEPTADQRRRLEEAADRADMTATVAGVIPGRETEATGLFLDEPFWNRRVYATDYAFDVLTDEELTALCARTNAADEFRLLERRSLVVALLFGSFLVVTVWRSLLLALVVLVVAWPLLVRYLHRCEFAADRRGARAVGAEPLVSAYEAGQDLTDDRGRLTERLVSRPSTVRRLERLEQLDV